MCACISLGNSIPARAPTTPFGLPAPASRVPAAAHISRPNEAHQPRSDGTAEYAALFRHALAESRSSLNRIRNESESSSILLVRELRGQGVIARIGRPFSRAGPLGR